MAPPNGEGDGLLAFVWSNCANQQISFIVRLTNTIPLNATLSTYGAKSYAGGYLGGLSDGGVASAHGTTTVTLTVYLFGPISPNAIIDSISGNVTALDPGTGQAISLSTPFVAH